MFWPIGTDHKASRKPVRANLRHWVQFWTISWNSIPMWMQKRGISKSPTSTRIIYQLILILLMTQTFLNETYIISIHVALLIVRSEIWESWCNISINYEITTFQSLTTIQLVCAHGLFSYTVSNMRVRFSRLHKRHTEIINDSKWSSYRHNKTNSQKFDWTSKNLDAWEETRASSSCRYEQSPFT